LLLDHPIFVDPGIHSLLSRASTACFGNQKLEQAAFSTTLALLKHHNFKLDQIIRLQKSA